MDLFGEITNAETWIILLKSYLYSYCMKIDNTKIRKVTTSNYG